MKKFFIPMLAVLFAIGNYAFTPAAKPVTKPLTNYVWFNVNSGKGNLTALEDAEVTFNSALSSAPSGSYTCDMSGSNKCVVGFNANQVDGSGQHLISGDQDIQHTAVFRINN